MNRTLPYYLVDGVYPDWALFFKTIVQGNNRSKKENSFSKAQEAVRKYIYRAFGVLLSRWHILMNTCRFWKLEDMNTLMMCCIVIHNMIV